MSSLRHLPRLCSTLPTTLTWSRAGSCPSGSNRAYSAMMMIRHNHSQVRGKLAGRVINISLSSSSTPSSFSSSSPHHLLHTSAPSHDSFKVQDEEDFNQRVLKSKKPVVVQFHATWCGPCKMLSPRMEKSISATKDAIDLAQVDIDENPDIAMSYSVGAVPAVMAIKGGKVVDKFVGLKDEDQIDTFIEKLNR